MSKQKYTIANVQQNKLIEYDLDIKDAFILTYLREIFQVKKLIEKEIDGERYIWVDYQKLITYLPVLKISSEEVIGRRMTRYEKLGLIKRHLHRSMAYGTYTFFTFGSKFNSLFEIDKTKYDEKELEKIKEKMGLTSPQSTFQSGGSDSKVGTEPTQRSTHNTPIHNTPIQDKSSSTSPTAVFDDFEKNLKTLLSEFCIKNINKNSIKNIKKYSNGDIDQVKKVLKFMNIKNKSMTPSIIVAILRDGDYTEVDISPKELKRKEKINFMQAMLGEREIWRLRCAVINSLGFEGEYADTELGNVLCRKFNEYIESGGTYV